MQLSSFATLTTRAVLTFFQSKITIFLPSAFTFPGYLHSTLHMQIEKERKRQTHIYSTGVAYRKTDLQ